jgi:hypothetical protein
VSTATAAPRTFTIPSHSDPDLRYSVMLFDSGAANCTCRGYCFAGRCRHIGEARDIAARQSQTMCSLCHQSPVFSGFQFCQSCAAAELASALKAAPRLCDYCHIDVARQTGNYCGDACEEAAALDERISSEGATEPTLSGLCQCGCGKQTDRARKTIRKQGVIKGHYLRFRHGHYARIWPGRRPSSLVDYLVEDRGYETPCWVWKNALDDKGYALTHVKDTSRSTGWRTVKVAGIYWRDANGPVPAGYELHHKCYTPACVRADHLETVTRSQHRRLNRNIRLSPAIVVMIRSSALPNTVLARQLGCAVNTVRVARIGETWADIAEDHSSRCQQAAITNAVLNLAPEPELPAFEWHSAAHCIRCGETFRFRDTDAWQERCMCSSCAAVALAA